jgi:isopentenyl phosphate kinase
MGWSRLATLIFVKLGGSIITDKLRPSTTRPEVIRQLAQEIQEVRAARPDLRLVVGHGSGSFGHVVGSRYHVHHGIAEDGDWWGYAETGAAAARLNRIVADLFLEASVPIVSVQPSACVRCRAGELVAMETYAIAQALGHGLVPLVYGDVAFDEQQGCAIVSTENVLAYLAEQLRPARMVMVGQVHGVYDRDPLADPAAEPIPLVTPSTFGLLAAKLGGSHGTDVTGGMLSKVREMVGLVARGVTQRVHLISGWHEGALARVLLDAEVREGTLIIA